MPRKVFILTGVLFIGLVISAQAGIRFPIVGGVGFMEPTYKPRGAENFVSPKPLQGTVAGLGMDFSLGGSLSLGLHIMYSERLYQLNTLNAGRVSFSARFAEAPLVFRYWLNHVISLGLGGYAALGLGNVQTRAAVQVADVDFPGAGIQKTDFGAIGLVGLDVPVGQDWGLVVEGRYLFGVRDANNLNGGSFARWLGWQALGGIRLGQVYQ